MATILKLGPTAHGRPMTLPEFLASDYEEGCQYELIDGRLYVSPLPNHPYAFLELWLQNKLARYADERSDVINMVMKGRVFVPGKRATTCPEPDVAAYHDYPYQVPLSERRWEDLSPLLVGEILSTDDPDKDLVRNVALYLQVSSIREYWVVDPREDLDHPQLLVYRRRGQRWQSIITVKPGETYVTRLLPGFELVIDPGQ